MRLAHDETAAAITDILGSCAPVVRPAHPRRWKLALDQASPCGVTVTLDSRWLAIDMPLAWRKLTPDRAARLLQDNRRLPGGVKFSVSDGVPRLAATVEIPLEDETDLGPRIRAAIDGLQAASEMMQRPETAAPGAEGRPDPAPAPGCQEAEAGTRLQRLAEEAGWTFNQRRDGSLAASMKIDDQVHLVQLVPFDAAQGRPGHVVRGAAVRSRAAEPPQNAALQREAATSVTSTAASTGEQGVYLWTELEGAVAESTLCRYAADMLLLAACRTVRMARASADHAGPDSAYRWEMLWDRWPLPAELSHGLAALAVACQLTAQEVAALRDQRVATAYLAARGWSS